MKRDFKIIKDLAPTLEDIILERCDIMRRASNYKADI
jgi:hypothetical protein